LARRPTLIAFYATHRRLEGVFYALQSTYHDISLCNMPGTPQARLPVIVRLLLEKMARNMEDAERNNQGTT